MLLTSQEEMNEASAWRCECFVSRIVRRVGNEAMHDHIAADACDGDLLEAGRALGQLPAEGAVAAKEAWAEGEDHLVGQALLEDRLDDACASLDEDRVETEPLLESR